MSEAAHIVVVDDDADVRETVSEYLRRNGFSVSEADGGESLRALMAERPIDLAILDINMPGVDGLTLARDGAIRNYEQRQARDMPWLAHGTEKAA